MKQNRFKQRLAMLMMAGMTVSQISVPTFAVDCTDVPFGYYGKQLIEGKDNYTTAAQIYASMYKFWKNNKEDLYKAPLEVAATEIEGAKFMEYVNKTYNLDQNQARALQALAYDHPEFYWIVGSKTYASVKTTEKTNNYGGTVKGEIEQVIKTLSEVEASKGELDEINSAITAAVSDINKDLAGKTSTYDKVAAINKYLISKFDYNEDAINSESNKVEYQHAHTLLGAFVGTDRVAQGKVVCEGYAKAFKAIGDQMGINSVLVSGKGTNSQGKQEDHMWNYVEIGGKWYLVDVTWNDPIGGNDKICTDFLLVAGDGKHLANEGVLSSTEADLGMYFTYPTVSTGAYKQANNNADLTSIEYSVVEGKYIPVSNFKNDELSYKVVLPEDTPQDAKIDIRTAIADPEAQCDQTPVPFVLKDGKGHVELKVTAADGKTSNTYTIDFSTAQSDDASLSSISYWVGGEKYDVKVQPGQKEIAIEVPYTTPEDAQVDIKAVPTNSAAKAEYQPIVLEAGKGTGVVNVVSADGKNKATYKINITTKEDPRSKANDITSFVLAGAEGKIENNVINVEVPYGTELTKLTPTIKCSDKATVVVKGTDGVTADFSNPVTYVVTAENGTTKEYTVNVKVLSSIIVNQGLNNIKVYKGKNATFEIKYTPTISGDYTIVWNSATQKNVESHITLEADKTTSSALVLEKVTSADQGEVSVKISRDADSSDFVESKANFKLKSSNSSSGADSTTSSTNNNTSGGGGGGSATPAADKKVSEAWKDLSTAKQEEVKANFTNKMPYVLPANGLTEELVKELLGSDFSDAQVKEIVADPSKLKDLGISYTADTAVLTPVEEVNFKDINDSHWAYGNVEKLAKLGVVKGFEDNSFRPKEALAVADTFTFLNRVMLLNNDTYMNLSRETVEKYVTNKESWAFKDVATISSKLSEETLKEISALGDKPLSRGLLAQVLFEATQGKLAQSADSINFVDTQNSSYKEAIDYCVRAGLLKGVSANKMQPEKALTRAELMTVLVRLNDLMK